MLHWILIFAALACACDACGATVITTNLRRGGLPLTFVLVLLSLQIDASGDLANGTKISPDASDLTLTFRCLCVLYFNELLMVSWLGFSLTSVPLRYVLLLLAAHTIL